MKRKTLLALLFATGSLQTQPAVLAANESSNQKRVDEFIKSVDTAAQIGLELAAYKLLSYAEVQLLNSVLNPQPPFEWNQNVSSTYLFEENTVGDSGLLDWVRRVSWRQNNNLVLTTNHSQVKQDIAKASAKKFVDDAVSRLRNSNKSWDSMPMYWVAASLYERCDDPEAAAACRDLVLKYIQECENATHKNKKDVRSAASLLNLMAGGIPETASRWNLLRTRPKIKIGAEEYAKIVKLRTRAAALLDNLSADDQQRRLAHRDLVLLYENQGDFDSARREKEILFNLVGVHDDSILQPQIVSCGHVLWWDAKPPTISGACGMG